MEDNMPTLEELTKFYNSEQYLQLLNEFVARSKRELGSRETDMFRLFFKLSYCQRRYVVLNVPFGEILSAIEKNTDTFINYQVAATEFFDEQEIDTTYLIEKFCEFYLLLTGDQNNLHFYLNAVKPRMHFSKRLYAEQITNLYNQTITNAKNTTNDTL